ncbi:MAG: thioredoxin domain-containing protein [Mycobacterium sp.]
MRRTLVVVALLASLLVASTACSRAISGTAQPDPNKPPVEIVEDGFGIKVGFPDAPVQLEIYTEPQCNHCADLQADFGDQIRGYLNTGQLTVIYRPMTFLDSPTNLHSERVANAMFAAATPAGDASTDAIAFQRFVEEVWKHYDAGADHPSDGELADMARQAGVPEGPASAIESGEPAVDVTEMQDTNFGLLYFASPVDTGTPTILDLNSGDLLDVYDDDWLSKVIAS